MTESNDSDLNAETKKLSSKELAKKLRREAYLRAKDFQKNDPKCIARKEAAKANRQAQYQIAKERHQAYKKTAKDKLNLKAKISLAIDLKESSGTMATVIPIDIHRLRQKKQDSKN